MKKKILLLSNNENVTPLYEWLKSLGDSYQVELTHDPLSLPLLKKSPPDLVISYNYQHIVKEDIIDFLKDRILNLHISLLPWNKGASPNIWSFLDNTPKGVTIHRLEKGLDTGKIIAQRELRFDEDTETLTSTYQKLNSEIVKLFIEHWEEIDTGTFTLKEQQGNGTYHKRSDLNQLLQGRQINYAMTITEFKKFMTAKNG